jgi:hypothetical protein
MIENANINRQGGPVRVGRSLTLGALGFASAVTLLMVLAPASGAIAHPTVLAAPYKGTIKSPSVSTLVTGCAKAKAPPSTWTPATGIITAGSSASSSICPKSIGPAGGPSNGNAGAGVTVTIPLKIARSGTHAVATSFSLILNTSQSVSSAPCPLKNLYPQPINAVAQSYCEDGIGDIWSVTAQVFDLTNTSWSSIQSYGASYGFSSYSNSTYCYNTGTPACSNSSSSTSSGFLYSSQAPGFSKFVWNGGTSWTMWTNGTKMVKTDKFALLISVNVYIDTYAYKDNLLGAWSGAAAARVNMSTLGNGLSVNSITIH